MKIPVVCEKRLWRHAFLDPEKSLLMISRGVEPRDDAAVTSNPSLNGRPAGHIERVFDLIGFPER